MKYIMFDDNGLPTPIVFPEMLKHSDLAAKIGWPVISAGFCSQAGNCWGESVSLNVKSKPEDSIWLKKLLTWE